MTDRLGVQVIVGVRIEHADLWVPLGIVTRCPRSNGTGSSWPRSRF